MTTRISIMAIMAFALITSCKKEEATNLVVNSGYIIGGFIVNEGNFGTANSSVCFLNYQTDSVEQDIYKTNNNLPVGNTAQSITLTSDYAFIVVNASNKVEVVTRKNFKHKATIEGLTEPRYLTAISATKAYVTTWGWGGWIGIIDLNNFSLPKAIDVGNGPEKMLFYNNMLYVANSGGFGSDNTISVINTTVDTIAKTIKTEMNPIDMELDADNNIWILCTGFTEYDPITYAVVKETTSALLHYNTTTGVIDKTIPISATEHPTILDISPDKQTLYYGGGMTAKGIYTISVSATTAPATPLINKSYYGFNIHPVSGDIYALDAGDFASNGTMIKYSSAGSKLKEYTTGINPNSIIFQ